MDKLNEKQSYLWPVANYMFSSSIPLSSYIDGISLYTSDFQSREIQDILKEMILTSSQCFEEQILDPPQVYVKGDNESSIQSFYDLFEIYIQDNFMCRGDEKIKNINDAYEKKNDYKMTSIWYLNLHLRCLNDCDREIFEYHNFTEIKMRHKYDCDVTS